MSALLINYITSHNVTMNRDYIISIINHTFPSTIRAVISTLTCMCMASNSTSDSECYLAVRVQVRVLLLPNCTRIKVCD